MKIATHYWTGATQPCSFSFCLQGGSVFADFDTDATGWVKLVRISFDGYGCCEPKDALTTMPADDSEIITESVGRKNINSQRIAEILYRYFDANKDVIWKDALVEND